MSSHNKSFENSEDFIEYLLKNSSCKKAPENLGLETLCLFDRDKFAKKRLKRILTIVFVVVALAAVAVISYIGFNLVDVIESLLSGNFSTVVMGATLAFIGIATFGILANRVYGMRRLVAGKIETTEGE
ncbi:MAG TPA: hypothetical protein PKV16_03040 [Caldisericia bacterium]|nr:hypothetical protein [Caldisericia bacterium]HPF48287.1 hypothetical protein [Caldisericia bacterium]HPI83534.1 hypothetical protein [Caldisericia bacterium]HPQ92740.1 hypothetical protein [Caldisericia bacterium]HRV74162.1 hypothetical protein [Caldisericia bacterium]